MFFWMQRRFVIRESLVIRERPILYGNDDITSLVTILIDAVNTSAKTIEKRMMSQIPEWNLFIGERERFKLEDEIHTSDDSGYNIISKYRLNMIAEINKIYDNNVFTIFLNGCKLYMDALFFGIAYRQAMISPRGMWFINVNFEMMCMEICSFVHDNAVLCKNPLDYFIFMQDQIAFPLDINEFYKETHPSILHCFSDWMVFDPTTKHVYIFPSFVESYLVWILLMIHWDSPNLLTRTMRENGLNKLYAKIFRKDLEKDAMDVEPMPEHYGK
jgi:hypothetical protein